MCRDHYVRHKHNLIMRHVQVGALIVFFTRNTINSSRARRSSIPVHIKEEKSENQM